MNKLTELLPRLEVAAAEAMISHQQLLDPVRQKEDRLHQVPTEGEEAEPTEEGAKGLCHTAKGGSRVAEGTVC